MNLFPHPEIREIQHDMIEAVRTAVKGGKLIVHAPTGLGKTAASLAPALEYAISHDKVVLFLTSRHTQHKIAVETLQDIKKKYDIEFSVADIIGRRWMCAQNVEKISSRDFTDYCKKVKEDYTCEFYVKTCKKNMKATAHAMEVVKRLRLEPRQVDDINKIAKKEGICPYEVSTMLAKDSRVIVADYNYMFNDAIRDGFLRKIERTLEEVIIIVDEGHNLPNRIRDMLSDKVTSVMFERAIKEAKKYKYSSILGYLVRIQDAINELGSGLGDSGEKKITKKEFVDAVSEAGDYDEVAAQLALCGEDIREKQRVSFIGVIGNFLGVWQGEDEGYTRMIKNYGRGLSIVYRCLDPSVRARPVVKEAHSTIVMSGTLTPTNMYRDLLGMDGAVEKVFPSPFPEENKLVLVVPKTTTKYSRRNEAQYKGIGEELGRLCDTIPGNVAAFFPSYFIRDQVYRYFFDKCKKTIIQEEHGMNKAEKQEMLELFKDYKKTGAVLLGVVSANFSEGIDLPGDFLQGVIVVGLPLSRPDLETKELINYYDKKFGKGWDYGYVFPAFNKTLQASGRCIRSETDKGVVVFLDERYAWPSYIKCFPEDVKLKVSKEYEGIIKSFFRH